MITATVKTTRMKILSYACIVLAVIIGVILFFGGKAASEESLPKEVSISEIRSFLSSRGIEALGEPIREDIVLPKDFDEVLEEYNEILKEGGYDLKPYLGKSLIQYSFAVSGKNEVYAKVYVFEGKIIAAELSNHITGEQKAID